MGISLCYRYKIKRPILIADVISGVVLLLLLYTSLSKLADHEVFKAVLTASPLLRPFAGLIAWALPLSEILVVVLLFIPSKRLGGLYIALVLISIFTIYLAYMVLFSPRLPCNCGGSLKFLTWPQHVFFNLFFILLSILGIVLYRKGGTPLNSSPP